MTASAVRSPLEILELARTIFASTHWTTGHMSSEGSTWNDETGQYDSKMRFCSVGGLRFAALAPMEHALDETWMVAHGSDVAEPMIEDHGLGIEVEAAYLEALEALFQEALPHRWEAYVLRQAQGWRESYADQYEPTGYDEAGFLIDRVHHIEDAVIRWNDSAGDLHSQDYARTSVILPAFDRAVANLKSKEAQA